MILFIIFMACIGLILSIIGSILIIKDVKRSMRERMKSESGNS